MPLSRVESRLFLCRKKSVSYLTLLFVLLVGLVFGIKNDWLRKDQQHTLDLFECRQP